MERIISYFKMKWERENFPSLRKSKLGLLVQEHWVRSRPEGGVVGLEAQDAWVR